MPVPVLLAKLALPAVLVAGGVGAAAYATTSDGGATTTSVASGAPDAWIDAPLGDKVYAPGTIDVYAHATADDQIRAIELEVDGKVVGTDASLERTEKLYGGVIPWKAKVGVHQLQVRPVGGDGAASAILVVEVAKGGVVAPATTTTTTTDPGETTTTSSSSTTSTSTSTTQAGGTTVTVAPPDNGGGTIPPPTSPRPTAPPPTSPPTTAPPAAVIDSASVFSPYGDNRLYVPACGYSMQVTATVRNATSVRVQVEGTAVSAAMSRSGSTYTYTLRSGQFAAGDVGVRRVLVIASGGGASPTATAGRADIRATCPKD